MTSPCLPEAALVAVQAQRRFGPPRSRRMRPQSRRVEGHGQPLPRPVELRCFADCAALRVSQNSLRTVGFPARAREHEPMSPVALSYSKSRNHDGQSAFVFKITMPRSSDSLLLTKG